MGKERELPGPAPEEHRLRRRGGSTDDVGFVHGFGRRVHDLDRDAEDRGHFGWRQDDIFMAYLGLTDEAREYLVGRARSHDRGERFPAFWGPNYDWTPDQDHGGILMKAVQAMLMQTEGHDIFLLPAWPEDWDADFKLHAPERTVVEGTVRNGKLETLKVTPEARRKDVTPCSSNRPVSLPQR